MVSVLSDPSLYEFTGGTPPTLEELTDRYARQAVGHSPDGTEQWLNWVVLLDSTPVGYVQATVVGDSAEIAWVISPSVQGRGLATEAAREMVELLTAAGVRRLVAHVHPDHAASARVAERLGLRRTDVVEDGEVRWVRDFHADWQAWRDAREERLRDPHGWLSITAIHWLTSAPQRFDDAPGEWSGDDRRATVTLAPGETLGVESGATLAEGVHVFGPLDDIGLRLTFGDAVVQVAERDGRVIVRPRHPDSPNLRAYRGTPCYPADPAWVLPGRFEPYAAARRGRGRRGRLRARRHRASAGRLGRGRREPVDPVPRRHLGRHDVRRAAPARRRTSGSRREGADRLQPGVQHAVRLHRVRHLPGGPDGEHVDVRRRGRRADPGDLD